MGTQSAHGNQNVQLQNVQGPVWITFSGQPNLEARAGSRGAKMWFGVPAESVAFTGRRSELERLEQALAADGKALITQAITGLGGVGKTQLAARYVHTHGHEYDLVAWIRAEDGGVADLSELAAKLGEPVDGVSPVERRDLALDRLARCEERWLLVLDDVETPQQLQDCLPRRGAGRVLVTSRTRDVRQFAPLLSLDVFDEVTAISYLTERADRPIERSGATQVARALGYLPLALSHAAAYCAAGTSFEDYLDLLDALPAVDMFDSNPEISYAQTVASTWKASIEAASANANLAADVLAMAAHLGPDAIPKSLFMILIDPNQASERKRLVDAVNALARFSLATVDDDSVSLHRLLQKVVRDDARARDDRTEYSRALAALDDAFPNDPSDPARWPLSEQLLGHVTALADAGADFIDGGPQLIGMLNRASRYLIWAGGGPRALVLAKLTRSTAERTLGVEHPQTLTARNREAVANRQAGRHSEAATLLEALLADQRQILGPEHSATLLTYHELASAYRALGRVPEAIAIYEPLLAARERVLGPKHPSTNSTRHELAGAYRLAGRVPAAIAIYEQLITDRERTLGEEHPETLTTRHNLASAYVDVGRVPDAIAIYERLLDARTRVLGPEHPSTLATRNELAVAYRRARRMTDALAILEPLVADCERIFGPDHPESVTTRTNLAATYADTGHVEQAVAMLETLVNDCERGLGSDHPGTLSARHNLASGYADVGRSEEAIALYERLLADRERILGSGHPHTVATRRNLAAEYRAVGRHEDAEALSRRGDRGDAQ